MHWIYLIHNFHNLSWITEINELFHDILIYWDALVYLNWFIYCGEWLPRPLILIITPSFNAAQPQAPDGSGCVREEGRWNSQVWRRVMRHTWCEWSLITSTVKRRGRLSSGDQSLSRACTLVSSWVQEGSVEGFHATRAAGPAVRTWTAPAIWLTGHNTFSLFT